MPRSVIELSELFSRSYIGIYTDTWKAEAIKVIGEKTVSDICRDAINDYLNKPENKQIAEKYLDASSMCDDFIHDYKKRVNKYVYTKIRSSVKRREKLKLINSFAEDGIKLAMHIAFGKQYLYQDVTTRHAFERLLKHNRDKILPSIIEINNEILINAKS